jgi:uncharacterized protein (TIGR00369 family)
MGAEMADRERVASDLRERIAASPFHSGLGLSVDDADRGRVVLSMQARADQLNLQGLVHGGVLATLADAAMGMAVRTAVEPGRRHVTIELAVRYLRAAQPGSLVGEGRTVKVGSQIAFADATIRDADGALLATASGTYSVTPERG